MVDVDGLGKTSRRVKAESEIDRFFVFAGFDAGFIGGQVAKIGERKIHLVAVTEKVRSRQAGLAFDSAEAADMLESDRRSDLVLELLHALYALDIGNPSKSRPSDLP